MENGLYSFHLITKIEKSLSLFIIHSIA